MSITLPKPNATFGYGLPPRWKITTPFVETLETNWPGISRAKSLIQLNRSKVFQREVRRFDSDGSLRRALRDPAFQNHNLQFFGNIDASYVGSVLYWSRKNPTLPTKGRKQSSLEKQLVSAARNNLRTLLRHPIDSPYVPHNTPVTIHSLKAFRAFTAKRKLGGHDSVDPRGFADPMFQRLACAYEGDEPLLYFDLTHELCHCAESLKIYIHVDRATQKFLDLCVMSGIRVYGLSKTRTYAAFVGLHEALTELLAMTARLRMIGVKSHQYRYGRFERYFTNIYQCSYLPQAFLMYMICDEIAQAKGELASDVLIRAFRLHAAGDPSFYDELLEHFGNSGFRALARVNRSEESVNEFIELMPRFSYVHDALTYTADRHQLMHHQLVPSLQKICRQSDSIVGQRDRSMSH